MGPAANASVDSMGVAVTSGEGPVRSGTLGWLNSDAKNSAPVTGITLSTRVAKHTLTLVFSELNSQVENGERNGMARKSVHLKVEQVFLLRDCSGKLSRGRLQLTSG